MTTTIRELATISIDILLGDGVIFYTSHVHFNCECYFQCFLVTAVNSKYDITGLIFYLLYAVYSSYTYSIAIRKK